MSTTRQKEAARRNLKKARAAQRDKAHGKKPAKKPASRSQTLSTAQKNDLPARDFAFTKQRKEPLTDARHVRNAIARFDQVEDVTDADRDKAWKKIRTAARKYDIDVEADDWRELFRGGKAKKKR